MGSRGPALLSQGGSRGSSWALLPPLRAFLHKIKSSQVLNQVQLKGVDVAPAPESPLSKDHSDILARVKRQQAKELDDLLATQRKQVLDLVQVHQLAYNRLRYALQTQVMFPRLPSHARGL